MPASVPEADLLPFGGPLATRLSLRPHVSSFPNLKRAPRPTTLAGMHRARGMVIHDESPVRSSTVGFDQSRSSAQASRTDFRDTRCSYRTTFAVPLNSQWIARRAAPTNLPSNVGALAALVTSTPLLDLARTSYLHRRVRNRTFRCSLCLQSSNSDAHCVGWSHSKARSCSGLRCESVARGPIEIGSEADFHDHGSIVGDENGNTQCRLTRRIKGESCRDGSEGCGQDRREPWRGRQRT